MTTTLDLPHLINNRYRTAFRNDFEHLAARLNTISLTKRRPAIQHATIPHRHPTHYKRPGTTP